jgi:hypothetical protein
VIICGVDPGREPGYALVSEAGRVLSTACTRPAWTPHVVAVEGQWEPRARKGRKARVQDVLTLALRAGYQARAIAGEAPVYVLPPNVWRAALGMPDGVSAEVCANRIWVEMLDEERALLSSYATKRRGDVLAAIGIARAWMRLVRPERYRLVAP